MQVIKNWPSMVAVALTIITGVASLAEATDGGQAWTSESARRLNILSHPVTLSDAEIVNNNGQTSRLLPTNVSESESPLIFMDFIYTRCLTVCTSMGVEFSKLKKDLIRAGIQDQVKLMSISFDPRDSIDDLQEYLFRFTKDNSVWSAVTFTEKEKLEIAMKKLGVVAIPEPNIGFIHNQAVYVIHEGKVVNILNYNDRSKIQQTIKNYISANI